MEKMCMKNDRKKRDIESSCPDIKPTPVSLLLIECGGDISVTHPYLCVPHLICNSNQAEARVLANDCPKKYFALYFLFSLLVSPFCRCLEVYFCLVSVLLARTCLLFGTMPKEMAKKSLDNKFLNWDGL